MNYNCEVDWTKTKDNIRGKLKGRAYPKAFSDSFGLCERGTEMKLELSRKSTLTISELAKYARYLDCDIMDLIVFQNESYIEYPDEFVKDREPPEHRDCEEVNDTIILNESDYEKCQIRDVYELLLYLPLIDDDVLRDVVYRCSGNLGVNNRRYIRQQLNYLHRSIANCPEKQCADEYRDNVLRVKGDPSSNFYKCNYSREYELNLMRYYNEGNNGRRWDQRREDHIECGDRKKN